MSSTKGHCFEIISLLYPLFRTKDGIYLSGEIYFSGFRLVFCVYFDVTLKLSSVFHLNEIYFLEWSRHFLTTRRLLRVL